MIAPRALGVVESTVVDDEKTVTFATNCGDPAKIHIGIFILCINEVAQQGIFTHRWSVFCEVDAPTVRHFG